MMRTTTYLFLIFFLFLFSIDGCENSKDVLLSSHQIDSTKLTLGHGYDFKNNGKDKTAPLLPETYNLSHLDSLELPIISEGLVEALEYQLKLLQIKKQKKQQHLGNLDISLAQLETVIKQLLAWQYTQPLGLTEILDAYQIKGEDLRGNVHFTGYFTPVIKVSKKKSKHYQYPIYTRPKNWSGEYPTRAEIDGEGAFEGRGLEIAYARNPVDVYFMQVQGSGYVEYPDGTRMLFSYDGTNKQPYKSIGRFLVNMNLISAEHISMNGIRRLLLKNPSMIKEVLYYNPSYTFFTPKKSKPIGAGLVPLTTNHSIAVDRKYIPLGACLLAKVPVVNEKGRLLRHEFRFLVAQDVGGAIKGPGHVDLYSGDGPEGKKKASYLHHYGKLWLLLPKKKAPAI